MPITLSPSIAPRGSMMGNPIIRRSIETDVTTGALGEQPFVPQNLLAFR